FLCSSKSCFQIFSFTDPKSGRARDRACPQGPKSGRAAARPAHAVPPPMSMGYVFRPARLLCPAHQDAVFVLSVLIAWSTVVCVFFRFAVGRGGLALAFYFLSFFVARRRRAFFLFSLFSFISLLRATFSFLFSFLF